MDYRETEYAKKLRQLQLAQCEAQGALKGHVTFMLACYKYGSVPERMWDRLQQYHDEAERVAQDLMNHAFSNAEVM